MSTSSSATTPGNSLRIPSISSTKSRGGSVMGVTVILVVWPTEPPWGSRGLGRAGTTGRPRCSP
jgi:hypothetical protein